MGLFINTKNALYVTRLYYSGVQVWYNNSLYPTFTAFGNFSSLITIFVTINDDIYVVNYDGQNDQVAKLILDTSKSVTVLSVPTNCYGLFVDISNTIYCSVDGQHVVVKKWLDDNTTTPVTVAGIASAGSASNMLNNPNGIFVDVNFDLYVADLSNNRIQLFRLGALNGITVAGNTSSVRTITLNNPLGVVLDADKYLFIVDSGNNRIVGQGPNGFRCLVGCEGVAGSSSSQLKIPRTLSFDSHGNMFVTDVNNNRIQKFLFTTNSCGMFNIIPSAHIFSVIIDAITTIKQAETTQVSSKYYYKMFLHFSVYFLGKLPATSLSSAPSTFLTPTGKLDID